MVADVEGAEGRTGGLEETEAQDCDADESGGADKTVWLGMYALPLVPVVPALRRRCSLLIDLRVTSEVNQ